MSLRSRIDKLVKTTAEQAASNRSYFRFRQTTSLKPVQGYIASINDDNTAEVVLKNGTKVTAMLGMFPAAVNDLVTVAGGQIV
jgi:hypothetical protein